MAPLISPLNEKLYDELATKITYYKLFPLILEDFLARSDAKIALTAPNLVLAGTAGKNAITGTANGVYRGDRALPEALALKAKYKIAKTTGKVPEKVVSAV